ncbi:MAG: 50S ribosomal protein L7Ae [Candidatus Methanomethylicaceae archaeon]|jgi:large subunit ribosomal protein L7Ae
MSKKAMFVRFEVTPEIMERAYETVKLAKEDGKLRKGANEATKAVERGIAKLLVIAVDVDPPEIVAHLPLLSEDKKITYVYVDSKKKLGEAAGIDVPTSAVAVVDAGKGKPLLEEVLTKVAALRLKGAPETVKEESKVKEPPKEETPKKVEEPPKEKPKKEKKAPKKVEESPKEKPKKEKKAE